MPLHYLQRHLPTEIIVFGRFIMGIWGYHFNENDTYNEVQELFISLFKSGKSDIELTDMILEKYYKDPDYHIVVIALADCLWHCNLLSSRIYDMIQQIQEENIDTLYLESCDADKDTIAKRKELLVHFIERIKTPPSKNEMWDLTAESCFGSVEKGSLFWYRYNKNIYGAVVLDIQKNNYYLIAVSEALTHIPDTTQDVLNSQLYTVAWFSDIDLLPLKRMHFIGSIKIEDDFNGRAGFKMDQSGNLQMYNCGQSCIWKHSNRNINLHNASMQDVLHKNSLPLFNTSYI